MSEIGYVCAKQNWLRPMMLVKQTVDKLYRVCCRNTCTANMYNEIVILFRKFRHMMIAAKYNRYDAAVEFNTVIRHVNILVRYLRLETKCR